MDKTGLDKGSRPALASDNGAAVLPCVSLRRLPAGTRGGQQAASGTSLSRATTSRRAR